MQQSNKSVFFVIILIAALACSMTHCNVALAANINSISEQSATTQLVNQLEWIASNDPQNICHGYFTQPQLDASGAPILPPKSSVTTISADSAQLVQKSKTILNGNVIVLQPGRRLVADHAVIIPAKNGKYKTLMLFGNVRAYEPGQLIVADAANFNLLKKTGVLKNIKYRVLLVPSSQINSHIEPIDTNQEKLNGPVAWGMAKQATQTAPGHTWYSNVTYSTCAPDAAQWMLIASRMKLNKETEYGSAYNARLVYEGIPIFYTPYWSFPLTHKRKTGFLFPLYGYTSISGLELGLPFYWNIAPNYDDTITPTYYSERGVLFQNRFRYLTRLSYGDIGGSFIPNDKSFKDFQNSAATNPSYTSQAGFPALESSSDDRYSYYWKDNTQFNPHWAGLVDYEHVSDDYYLQDFGNIPELITPNQILQRGQLQYANTHWTFTGLLNSYQTLHPVNRQPVLNAYSALPELSLDGNYPQIWKDLGFTWQNQAAYFTRSPGFNQEPVNGLSSAAVNGDRYETRPGLNYPYQWLWGYFDPQIQYDSTNYSLNNQLPTFASSISRNLPIFDIHSGVYFDRDVNLFNNKYDQTLEPELFYLYVPFVNQEQIPIFDSGLIPFDYSQLFTINRFSGLDRIGDANQLSYAMTTRFLDDQTGAEKFHFSLGQIYYFKQHRVQFCNTPGCEDFLTGLGAPPLDENVSPIAAATMYHLNSLWSFNGGYAWDPTVDKSITGSAFFQYSPALNQIFDVGYSFLRNGNIVNTVPLGSSQNNLSQLGVSTSWPLNDRWSALGIFNYNISQYHPQTYLGGLQYNNCCIDMRFLGGRVFSAINQVGETDMQNAFYFQIQFKGLGAIGDNVLSSMLTSGISGYVDPFQTDNYGLH